MSKTRKKKTKNAYNIKKTHWTTPRIDKQYWKKKQRLSEPEDTNEEFLSTSLDHHAPNTERIGFTRGQFKFISFHFKIIKRHCHKFPLCLSLSKREQKKRFMLTDLADLEPIIILNRKWEEISPCSISKICLTVSFILSFNCTYKLLEVFISTRALITAKAILWNMNDKFCYCKSKFWLDSVSK
ncbi:hypothetical protein BD770DRAFT_176522 [Pilaira anomala]|nr:hypothetical protein BD770DRAFT_176522 [Pilaira anomala]